MRPECAERRFDAVREREPVQWLADDGSPYTAAETIYVATALHLVACFTPVRSATLRTVLQGSSPETVRIRAHLLRQFQSDPLSPPVRPARWMAGFLGFLGRTC
jgi:hypothetical protein